VTCLDRSEQMLALARQTARGDPALSFVQADGGALPYADGAFDVVICTLALHHFDPGDAQPLLRELHRVARVTPVVCDLRRSELAFAATWLWSRTSSNRLTGTTLRSRCAARTRRMKPSRWRARRVGARRACGANRSFA